MGCDIHMFIEKRLSATDEWKLDENHVKSIEDGVTYITEVSGTHRHYRLFGILAGVRGGGCLYPPRGMPKDVSSDLVKNEEEHYYDEHHRSWLTLSEFKQCLLAAGYCLEDSKSTDAFCSDRFDDQIDYVTIVNYCEEWVANEKAEAILLNRTDILPEVRLIFWFDN